MNVDVRWLNFKHAAVYWGMRVGIAVCVIGIIACLVKLIL